MVLAGILKYQVIGFVGQIANLATSATCPTSPKSDMHFIPRHSAISYTEKGLGNREKGMGPASLFPVPCSLLPIPCSLFFWCMMATPEDGKEFIDLVRKSDVADSKRLDGYLQQLRTPLPTEPPRLAGQLVEAGLLTAYQAEQILQGKWKRFSIGKYRILDQLGKGGMASVFLCEHKIMRRRVAVKVLPSARANDPTALERFYREARAVAALDHPNIVHAYDIDQDESLHFLVMEYVEGDNLQDIVRQQGPLNVAQACHYIRQTAQGLDHAHQRGMVHRDIKPSNILVDRKGLVRILDMGLARFFRNDEQTLTKNFDENVLGSVDYLAPEQAEDSHDVDIRADIYSLGATFYFLLTGRTMFGEGTVPQKLMWHLQK